MCDYCDPVTEKQARGQARIFAGMLRELADDYDALANLVRIPHTYAAERIGLRAKAAIRTLVEDWL